jgi:hypothetical protein
MVLRPPASRLIPWGVYQVGGGPGLDAAVITGEQLTRATGIACGCGWARRRDEHGSLAGPEQ